MGKSMDSRKKRKDLRIKVPEEMQAGKIVRQANEVSETNGSAEGVILSAKRQAGYSPHAHKKRKSSRKPGKSISDPRRHLS